jgi:ABC-2 type transport system ATP-binding protein
MVMSGPAISVQDLCKQYGSVLAVDHISFDVQDGELVGFLGLNGAGKSTTMRILTTFMPASSGIAHVAGFDVMYQSMEVRQNLGYLPESVPLYPEMRVIEYLEYRAKLKQIDRLKRRQRIDYCLGRSRIKEVSNRLLGTLSKGYRQRVGLADALLADPKVLILDEPLTGLDPIQQEQTLQAIRDLGGQHTVLFSSHHLADVEKICDRVIIIDRGKLCFNDRLSTMSRRAPVLLFELRGDGHKLATTLKNCPGVTTVEEMSSVGDLHHYEVHTQDGEDLREAIAKRIFEQGGLVRKLDIRRERLEDVFAKMVMGR